MIDIFVFIYLSILFEQILDSLSNSTIKIELTCGFTRDETLQLFSKVLNQNVADLPNEACELHAMCKRNPFLLSLVANNLKEYTAGGIILWDRWLGIVKNHEYAFVFEIVFF